MTFTHCAPMTNVKICYIGIYPPAAPRDKVYLESLKKAGATVIECVDNSVGFTKFWRIFKKHRELDGRYGILWVGYLSTMMVPLARLISRKKIIFNALDSWYDRTVLDRGLYSRFSPVARLIWCIDFLAFNLSDIVLVESEQQKIFISKKFFVSSEKIHAIFTGVDESVFYPDPLVKKSDRFTVVFRGMFLPATGVEYVFEAARLLKGKDVHFRIIGWGQPLERKLQKMIRDYGLSNVELTTVFLSQDELRKTLLSSHVMLGQFSSHPRLDRTIQNKTFEALALGMPYITRDSLSNRELLAGGQNCIFVFPQNVPDIVRAIESLKNDILLRNKISAGALYTYGTCCSSGVLGRQVLSIVNNIY